MKIVPISAKRQRQIFTMRSCRFGAKPAEEKRDFQRRRISHPLPAVLPPVGRCVASQGGGRVRIPPGSFGSVSGRFSVRRKYSRRKGWGRAHSHPGHFCPQCGQFHGVYHRGREMAFPAGGGVGNRKSHAAAEKTAGSQQNFKEENTNDK